MSRRTDALVLFDALSIEGALLPAEWLAEIARLDAPAQEPADYGVPKGLELRDEITRYWRIAEALWADFVTARAAVGDGAEAPITAFISQLLTQVFGFADLRAGGRREAGGREFRIAFEALGGRVPVVVGVPAEDLEAPVARYGEGRRRSAWDTVQEYLNASDRALWGIATNGLRLRVGRDNSSLTRPAWIEADLERIFDEERFADFSVLWLLLHATRFGRPDAPPSECPLETWREKAREAGTRARDKLRDGVEAALLALGKGFLAHPDNTALRQALAAGQLSPEDYFNELLRLVYRMIFLLTVEERGILHGGDVAPETRALYDEGYSIRRLRERALRRSQYDRHGDLWASLQPVFTALGRAGGEPALGLPELGGLFAADQCPHLDACTLENRALLEAVFRLAWLREDSGLARVNWKDMGPEELGSIYESLLELVPRIADGGRDFYFEGAAGNARKTTGSYYTPDELVQQLLDTALDPVVEQRLAAHPEDPEGALLGITVLDPACGSGHFLLAAARRLAARLAGIRASGAPGAHEYRIALRDVITHCIYGVDRNPMALELARMSLWLESYTPDRALGFLDHHLVPGDSLLGLLDLAVLRDGIPDDAFKALTGDDPDAVKVLRKVNRDARKALKELRKSENLTLELGTGALEDAFARLDELSDDAIEDVEAKRGRYEELRRQAETSGIAIAADLYVGAFLMPRRLAPGERKLTERAAVDRFPQTGTLLMALDGTLRPEHPVVKAARKVCRDANVLHWPLAFPQVFGRGGFDVVVGNPPWERIKLQEQEFFAVRAPEIAGAPNRAARERAINRLARAPEGSPERILYQAFIDAKQEAEAASVFCHSDARYPLTGVGDVNTYALFAETGYRLIRANGRCGLVVPTGIATDDSTKRFFSEVVGSRRLVSLYDFENRTGLFPAVDSRQKFCLLTLGQCDEAEFAFFLTQANELKDHRRRFVLSAQDFPLINPNTRTCPVFRSKRDAEIVRSLARRHGVLRSIDAERDSGWSVRLRRMFDKSTDGHLLLPVKDRHQEEMVRVYEGEYGHQYNHRFSTWEQEVVATDDAWLANPANLIVTQFVSSEAAFYEKLARWGLEGDSGSAFLGFRRVARSTDERTVIACILPWTASTYGWILTLVETVQDQALLCGLYNSIVFDWLLRCKLSQPSIPQGVFEQTLVPQRSAFDDHAVQYISRRVLELSYTAEDLRPWAEDLGYTGDPFRWDPERRAILRAELDAYYARLYGLTRDELRYILDPADVMGPDYPTETFRVLKQNEESRFGEYRTRRLVLEAWDRLEAGE